MRHLNGISSSMLDAACQRMAQNHPLRGTWVDGPKPLLVFLAPPKCVSQPEDLLSFRVCKPHRFIGVLGAHVLIPVMIDRTGEFTQVVVPQGDPLVERLRCGPFDLAFAHAGKYLAIEEGRLPDGEREQFFPGAMEISRPVLSDPAAAWYELLSHQSWLGDRLTVSDQLSAGWANAYACRVESLQRDLNRLRSEKSFYPHDSVHLSKAVEDCRKCLTDCDYRLEKLLDLVAEDVGDDGVKLFQLMVAGTELSRYERISNPKEAFQKLGTAMREVGETYAWSPRWTYFGHRVPWIDTEQQSVRMREIHPREFPAGFDAEKYWPRLLWNIDYECGHILSSHDIPVDPKRIVAEIGTFPIVENVAEANDLQIALLEEAMANKAWTIPPGAIVECMIGPFRHVELHEIASNVFAVFRTVEGETYQTAINPSEPDCLFIIPVVTELDEVDWQQKEKVEAAVRLALCAIVRDFWVLEEREQAFAVKRISGLSFRERPQSEAGHVVYLPRVQFSHHPATDRANDSLHYQERRAHTVSGHLRRCEHPSTCQIILASRYGFQVPDGFTFVRPHERGGGAVGEIIYRSRSAMQLLYPQRNVTADVATDGWFQFERQMRTWITAQGWNIEHVSESRQRDRSIEVFARREEADDGQAWIIHCRAVHPKRRVGLQAVGHLLNVLQQYPSGTRGMLIATGRFTTEARQRAYQAGIRLVDADRLNGLDGELAIAAARRNEKHLQESPFSLQENPS